MPTLWTFLTVFYVFTMASATASAQELLIAPYKDELFNYSRTLETRHNGRFELKEYDEMRDVNGRDQEGQAGKIALPKFVDESLIGTERNHKLKSKGVTVDFLEIGRETNASFVVIFAHGSNGTKELGMKDWSFGGNFSRLKHLAVHNNGLYISPSFIDFEQGGAAQIRALIKHVREGSPDAKIIMACASSGGSICDSAFFQEETLPEISAFILMATGVGPKMFASTQLQKYKPSLFLLHGTNDKLVSADRHYAAFSQFIEAHETYPARFQMFDQGGHGTPIRMIDWRETLNWILFKD